METKVLQPINGKVLVFTDQHLGLKGNSESRLKIVIQVFKDIIAYVKANNIKYVISAGDMFHSRTAIDVNVMNIAYKLVQALAKHCTVYILAGNHDIYLKSSTDVNSINIFQDIQNVVLLNSTAEMRINNKHCILVPWLGDLSAYSKESADFMFGHFDISSKFLMQMYCNDNKNISSASDQLSSEVDSAIGMQKEQEAELGSFIDIVKPGGVIFSGHIHTRKEMLAKGRKLIFIGSPYQQTLGDINCKCGFYLLDEKMKHSFHEITSVPKHIDIRMSDVIKDPDTFDFSIVKGNIVHKIYDVEVDRVADASIAQKILDMKPFEELLPDYEVKAASNNGDTEADENVELLKKSKLEYISNYIENIDNEALKDDNIDKKRLFEVLQKYYNEIA